MYGKYVISGASAAKQLDDNTRTQNQGQTFLPGSRPYAVWQNEPP